MHIVYGVLCAFGTVLPMAMLGNWIKENGFNVMGFILAMGDTPSSKYLVIDLTVAWAALMIFIVVEGNRLGVKKLWMPILGGTAIGASMGLPLFLMLRELHLRANN